MVPLLVYDGDCHFCRRWVLHWQRLTGDRVSYAPFQQVAFQFPHFLLAEFQRAVQLFDEHGQHVASGAEAVLRALACVPGKRWMWWAYRRIPGVAGLVNAAYRWVADHRPIAATITNRLWGDQVGPSSYLLTRWLFLRMMGVIYLVAFWSLGVQIHGLVGPHGILPAGELLQAARSQLGPAAYRMFPTLCWLSAGDHMLAALCTTGALLAVALILGFAQVPALVGLWVCYLSLTVVGQDFLAFQWDILLLETGFLAILLAPLHWLPRGPARSSPPSPVVIWLLRWLLFRLMFGSGLVKLASGDPTWHNLTALVYHYQTQPLPNWVAWHMYQIPVWFHVLSALFMFAVELGAPWLIFTPRRPRSWGFVALVSLQVMILLTGNYAFFNWLAIALCLWFLDDAHWPTWIKTVLMPPVATTPPTPWRWRGWVIVPVAGMVLFLSTTPALTVRRMQGTGPLIEAYRWFAPFRLVNNFGLFAVMTTSRPEIILEGSQDGIVWLAYEFPYKPGNPKRPPPWVAPHQPRLDWQMWFAALSTYQSNRWFRQLCEGLLQGRHEVTALFAKNPFPGEPPRYLRAVLYNYEFTDLMTPQRQGLWWRRQRLGMYCPVLSLKSS